MATIRNLNHKSDWERFWDRISEQYWFWRTVIGFLILGLALFCGGLGMVISEWITWIWALICLITYGLFLYIRWEWRQSLRSKLVISNFVAAIVLLVVWILT